MRDPPLICLSSIMSVYCFLDDIMVICSNWMVPTGWMDGPHVGQYIWTSRGGPCAGARRTLAGRWMAGGCQRQRKGGCGSVGGGLDDSLAMMVWGRKGGGGVGIIKMLLY